ncbi:hypothetical protein V7S43_001562 [Phytophthora oleae]|uniref:Uncharacterized protein n=1 Tax=Phytophthora oleae TaxID=2107226 RepID=A0ABD3G420_9STRA
MEQGGGDGNSVVTRVNSLRVLPTTDEQLERDFSPEDSGSSDTNDGCDTARVAASTITYARECLRSENYTEATLALRSALKISSPTTSSYKIVVLHIAQLLKAAQQLETSIECMTAVYQDMPPPFSRIDGICMIALTYEKLGLANMARMWWKKMNRFSFFKGLESCDSRFWEAIGNRLFDGDLYLYAAEFYAKAMSESEFVPSNRFRYCYLTSLLGAYSAYELVQIRCSVASTMVLPS